MPAMPELAVAGPVPTFEGVRFHRRNNVARHDLRFVEIALMEVLRDFPRHSEADIEEVARTVRRLENEGKLRFSKVEKAASSERSPALRRNLETVRELLHTDLAAG
jgi:hypothetical protein